MILQVILLMWLRTVVNYQYKTGVGIREAFRILYEEGGVWRFYRGVSLALVIAPISRFGDTAANEGITDLFSSSGIPVWAVTGLAALAAAFWRIVITPIDTVKTILQVSGAAGFSKLREKMHSYGVIVLWHGAFGNWLANITGYYPWYAVNNWLELRYPPPTPPHIIGEENVSDKHKNDHERYKYQRSKMIRRGFIGFCSSFVSSCISNGVRVVKTYGQTSDVPLTYFGALLQLWKDSGFSFLFRGLGLKLMCNCLSGIVFSILWKMFMDHMKDGNSNTASAAVATTTCSNGNSNGEEGDDHDETSNLLRQ